MPYTGSPGGQSGDGWFAVFSNKALGSIVLVLLIALVVVLFVRFLIALHRTGRAPQGGFDDDIRAQELFGENYDPMIENHGQALNTESGSPPLRPQQVFRSPDFSDDAGADWEEDDEAEEKPRKKGWLERRREKKQQAQDSAFVDDGLEPPADDDPFADASAHTMAPPRGEREEPAEEPARPAGDTFGDWLDRSPDDAPATTRRAPDIILPEELSGAAPEENLARGQNPAAGSPSRGARSRTSGRGAKPAPDIGRNPDATNPITTRSFSVQPRTGRPAKMTFRQGDPEDLDAIDE